MPPSDTPIDNDDYIISLLKRDAEKNQKRYLTNGLGSLLSNKRPNAPKPNTRFLKNIIRDTDSHNAALKAKEEQESSARLRELQRDSRKRRRTDDGDGGEVSEKRRKGEEKAGRWASALGPLAEGSKQRVRDVKDRDEREGYRDRRPEKRSRDHGRDSGERRKDRHRWRSDSRSASPRRRKDDKRQPRPRSASREPTPPNSHNRTPDSASDSDPLEPILGPRPAPTVLPRGRGAYKSSDINSRFDPSYNPKTDVALEAEDEDRDDWDMALEALRDRAKWKTQGAERLRAAGFTEEEVGKWESKEEFGGGNGADKDVQDVRWRKKGEKREWDRGKVLDGEGIVDIKPEWASSGD